MDKFVIPPVPTRQKRNAGRKWRLQSYISEAAIPAAFGESPYLVLRSLVWDYPLDRHHTAVLMSEDVAVEDEVTNVRSAEVHKRLYCGYGFTGLPDESTRAKVIPIQARRLVGRDIHYHGTNVPLLFAGSCVFCLADRRNRRRR